MRLLALAVLLFGIVLTHGASPDGVAGHLVTSAATPAAGPAEKAHGPTDAHGKTRPTARDERRGDHTPSHPAEHCAAGQPYQGPALTQPCFAVSVGEPVSPRRAMAHQGLNEPELSVSASASLRAAVVQQV
ncbi:hypothetical protein [Streptomyces spongiae]|uniref:hypothetical protein n=1 Tax=Streptomyces spongiae TaxID=565072 RepID=UPI002AD47B82|nr:hypothetical protein [Streptomyces spongiae]